MIKYKVNEDFERKGQTFSNLEDEWNYDEKIDNVVVVGKIDCQEIIQSNADCALDRILDKYLDFLEDNPVRNPLLAPKDDNVVYEHKTFDLNDYAEEIDRINALREKYHLPDEYSLADVINYCKDNSLELRDKISKSISRRSSKKEVVSDAKKKDELFQKQEELQENGSKSS